MLYAVVSRSLPKLIVAIGLVISSNYVIARDSTTTDRKNLTDKGFEEGKDFAKELVEKAKKPLRSPLVDNVLEKNRKCCPSQLLNLGNNEEEISNDVHKVPNSKPQILVFVSFSMPLATIKALSEAAEHYNAHLIIRGLVNNSFQETTAKLIDFKNGLEVNPQLFKDYQINAVPAFILLAEGKEKGRVTGNITLDYADKKLKGRA